MLHTTPDQRARDLVRRIAFAKRSPKTDPQHIEKLEADLRNRIDLLKDANCVDDRSRALRRIGREAAEKAMKLGETR